MEVRVLQQTASRNRKGVTLVEVLIAMTILLIVFMGLIQASILAIGVNMRNEIRDEVVSVASEELMRLRNLSFTHADLTATYAGANCPEANLPAFNNNRNNNAISNLVNSGMIKRQLKNLNVSDILEPAGNSNIGLRRDVCDLDADHKVMTVRVNWQWQGEVSAIPHRISTYRGR